MIEFGLSDQQFPAAERQMNTLELRGILKKYSVSQNSTALWQIANSVSPFVMIWALSLWLSHFSFWATLPLSILNGLLLTRIFVLQHDCGHHSLFAEKKWNDFFGNFLSLITFTPLLNWRREHNFHHSHIGNLDKTEHGDFWMMTSSEYSKASRFQRFIYRLYRNPFVLFGLGPIFYLLVRRRFSVYLKFYPKKERKNLWLTNMALLVVYGSLLYFFGIKVFSLIFFPTIVVGSSICVWGFYIQHTFEDSYWERTENWDYFQAAIEGSSYYDLPRWMLWFSADISVHHIHHADSGIPNYRLQECLRENPVLRPKKSITFLESLNCAKNKLWDEEAKRFVGFPSLSERS